MLGIIENFVTWIHSVPKAKIGEKNNKITSTWVVFINLLYEWVNKYIE